MAPAEQFLGRGYQGVVALRDTDAGKVVVKQAMGRGFALWLRRLMLRREVRLHGRSPATGVLIRNAMNGAILCRRCSFGVCKAT